MTQRLVYYFLIVLMLQAYNRAGAQTALQTGAMLTRHFVATPHTNFGNPGLPGSLTYSEVCTWYGALRYARISNDTPALKALEQRFVKLLKEEKKLLPRPDHVDNNVFGAIPFELYMITGDTGYLTIALPYADKQWELPQKPTLRQQQLADNGYSWQARYWIDDMFMITTVQTQAYRATGNPVYLMRAALQMAAYLDSLQQPNGLFYHAPGAPFFWGRGNGWMAVGMADLLKVLPRKTAYRKRILEGYRSMMKSLKQYQAKDGMWRQLINEEDAWVESSCTGMFVYAMATGVKQGWLNRKQYNQIVGRGWQALQKHINSNGDVTDVCEGTNIKNDKQHYLNRKRITGDMHGQAPVLWCTTVLM